jgi:hypothetical protein
MKHVTKIILCSVIVLHFNCSSEEVKGYSPESEKKSCTYKNYFMEESELNNYYATLEDREEDSISSKKQKVFLREEDSWGRNGILKLEINTTVKPIKKGKCEKFTNGSGYKKILYCSCWYKVMYKSKNDRYFGWIYGALLNFRERDVINN